MRGENIEYRCDFSQAYSTDLIMDSEFLGSNINLPQDI